MITIPNTIKNINPDYRILSTRDLTNSSEMFRERGRFKIEILVNLNKSNRLLREAKYIEVYLMSNNSRDGFSNQFKNSLLTETNNNKKYVENENFNNIFENDIRKNVFVEYNSSYDSSNSVLYDFSKLFNFEQENFISESSEIYKLVLDQDFSKKVYNKSIIGASYSISSAYFNNIRIAILDEKYNVIDISRFYDIDFSNSKLINEVEVIDINEYYRPQIENFVESLSIELISINSNFTNQIQISNNTLSNILGLDDLQYQVYLNYNDIQIQTGFFSAVNNIVVSSENAMGGSFFIERFLREISTNFYSGQQEFTVFLTFTVKQESSYGPIHVVQRSFNMNRDNTFIENYANFKELSIVSSIFGSIDQNSLGRNIQYEGPKLGIPLNINSSLQENNPFWQLIKVDSIKINNQELEFFYKNSSFNIESKVDYKGMSYKELFINGNFTIWRSLNQYLSSRNIIISIILIYNTSREINNTITSAEISLDTSYFEETAPFIPNSLNQLFKENLSCTGINPNFSLNESNRSIFLYDSFVLNNVEYFNDISLSYGYDNIPDFLNNCKIKINKTANINGVRRNDYSFANFNDMFTVDSNNFLITNNSFLSSFRFLDLIYNDFGEDSIYNNENNIYRFLTTTNKNEKQRILQGIENINIGNNLEFEILPIPKIIHDNIGCGFDDLNNISIRDNTGSVSEFENTLLLYLGNINQVRKAQIKNLMFSELNEITESLIETLLYYFKLSNGLSQNNFYTNNILYNKNQISDLINNQEETESDLESSNIVNSGIINRSSPILNYYNFNINETFIDYSNMPLSVNFSNKNMHYDRVENCYLPRDINFLYNFDEEIVLDTSHISSIINKFPSSLRFSEIKNEQHEINNPNIKISFHLILSRKENYDNSQIETRSQNRSVFQRNSLTDLNTLLDNRLRNTDLLVNDLLTLPTGIRASKYNDKNCIYNTNIREQIPFREFKSYLRGKQLDYTLFRELLDFAKYNGFIYLEAIVIRTHLNFNIRDNILDTIFTSKIPFLNFKKDSIKINNIREITTSLR